MHRVITERAEKSRVQPSGDGSLSGLEVGRENPAARARGLDLRNQRVLSRQRPLLDPWNEDGDPAAVLGRGHSSGSDEKKVSAARRQEMERPRRILLLGSRLAGDQ